MTPDRVKQAQQSLHGKRSISTWRSATEQLCLLQVQLPSDLHRAVCVRMSLIDANKLSHRCMHGRCHSNSISSSPFYNGSPKPAVPQRCSFLFFSFFGEDFYFTDFFFKSSTIHWCTGILQH